MVCIWFVCGNFDVSPKCPNTRPILEMMGLAYKSFGGLDWGSAMLHFKLKK